VLSAPRQQNAGKASACDLRSKSDAWIEEGCAVEAKALAVFCVKVIRE